MCVFRQCLKELVWLWEWKLAAVSGSDTWRGGGGIRKCLDAALALRVLDSYSLRGPRACVKGVVAVRIAVRKPSTETAS